MSGSLTGVSTLLALAGLLVLCFAPLAETYSPKAIPLITPVDSTSKLKVAEEGLDLLRSLDGPVAPIVVIGPYRSGKSFTLNQLLNVSCEVGFGVGHTRDTQTKGIWVWGEPQTKVLSDGTEASLIYVDTEGFESTGKSTTYDDRIFALSTLMSAVLIYNLPEAIRESDITKLSFAAELAQGFYDRDGDPGSSIKSSRMGSFEPGAMLWLIQRDFLLGEGAADVVHKALAAVPNPSKDAEITAINTIRASLTHIASNSTGFSLVQPHLDRTRLCEIPDSELEPKYMQQRDGLRTLVTDLAKPKMLNGVPYTGGQLASLISRMVEALNEQEIPNIENLIGSFNRDLVSRCVKKYVSLMEAAGPLPVDEEDMKTDDLQARQQALDVFASSLLGHKRGSDVKSELTKILDHELHIKENENIVASSAVCSKLESLCESEVDQLLSMRLPSMHKFESSFEHCEGNFKTQCVGPSQKEFTERLAHSWKRASEQFSKDYNDRLLAGLMASAGAGIVLFRLVVKFKLAELCCWVIVLILGLYPQLYTSRIMYQTGWWHGTVAGWEFLMWLLFGYDYGWVGWFILIVAAVVFLRIRKKRVSRVARPPTRGSPGRNTKSLDV